MNIFDIIGPVMVGPSSSHTAGAVRIGHIARKLLQDTPVYVDIILHGSFATTGVGHGTDKALIAGLLGMQPDDIRIPDSFSIAKKEGLKFLFTSKIIKDAHPNTAVLTIAGKEGHSLQIQAASIGGGRIMVQRMDGIDVSFSAEKPTIVVYNQDMPGYVAQVTSAICKEGINIATMQLYRAKRGGYAVMVLELDENVPKEVIEALEQYDGISKVTYINLEENHHVL
ncbi:MAG TPA: L-serine ammonia-lyase, iron-sulfur-dependent subunit beta [Lachnospiraceae bacterium]|nr:L-serine ammonia-lyase, iron-sulfur-dependent subunit beta [Lachnospiraceae bacterium]